MTSDESKDFMNNPLALVNLTHSSTLHDRVLIVGEKRFYISTLTLSLRSEHFHGLFNSNFADSQAVEVTIEDVDVEIFEIFLMLIYEGSKVELEKEHLPALIGLAYRFLSPYVLKFVKDEIYANFQSFDGNLMVSLFDQCATYGIENLRKRFEKHFRKEVVLKDTCCTDLLECAVKHDMKELTARVVEHIRGTITYENCSDYLDIAGKLELNILKSSIRKAICSWDNKIPSEFIIQLTKSAFQHKIKSLKIRNHISQSYNKLVSSEQFSQDNGIARENQSFHHILNLLNRLLCIITCKNIPLVRTYN